ncbi:hypothetical protein GQ600_6797 [Phytophthora cactorum]|nr:hypothetical protein GQ600_6797 [Phytophthora cactorum]
MDATAFDPLAALEDEYAAILAQSRPPAQVPAQPGDAESADSDSEDEESAAVGGFESYALLPSSPCNSDNADPRCLWIMKTMQIVKRTLKSVFEAR